MAKEKKEGTKKVIREQINEQEESGIGYNQMPPKDVFAYNELRSCSDLFILHNKKILEIQPEFQRNEVWPLDLQTRFIDSLLKELPIPSMCFSYDKDRNEMRVIDGLQRITSIIKFLNTRKEWKLSALEDIDPRISGKTNIQINKENPVIFSNIQNLSLPVTFLRVDHSKISHDEYLFEIFHRLNTYGRKLNNQEIRNCIFSGTFNNFIKDLNKKDYWKKLLNLKNNNRFLKTELILRFFAFFDDYKNYKGKLTKFLNDYMSLHRNAKEDDLEKKGLLFKETVNLILENISDGKVLPRKPSNAFMESLLFGVAKNLTYLKKIDKKTIKKYYKKLNENRNFKEENLLEGTMKVKKVSDRFKTAVLIFSGK